MRIVATLVLVAALAFPLAAAAGEASRAAINSIVTGLGYDKVFASFGNAAAIGATAAEERPKVAAELREAARASFDAGTTLPRVVERTDAALPEGVARRVFDFYESPLGRKVAALERGVVGESLAGPLTDQALEAALVEMEAARAEAPGRFVLYRRIGAAIRAESRFGAFSRAILRATLTGVFAGDPQMAPMLDGMVENAMTALESETRETYEQMVLLYGHQTLGELGTAELDRLAAVLETPDFAAFFGAMNAAVTAVVAEDSQRFGSRMGEILRANPGSLP